MKYQIPPVYSINPVKYIWEIRRDMKLDYDPNDPKQKLFYSELKNTFNSANEQNIDEPKEEVK